VKLESSVILWQNDACHLEVSCSNYSRAFSFDEITEWMSSQSQMESEDTKILLVRSKNESILLHFIRGTFVCKKRLKNSNNKWFHSILNCEIYANESKCVHFTCLSYPKFSGFYLFYFLLDDSFFVSRIQKMYKNVFPSKLSWRVEWSYDFEVLLVQYVVSKAMKE